MPPILTIAGVTKTYASGLAALEKVDLEIQKGEIFALLGPNGAGKTTAVRILCTLLRPDAGHARVLGRDVLAEPQRVRSLIGLTGQYAAVDETLTGVENLLFIGRLLGMSRPEAKARARELLTAFSLDDAADRAAKTYSGGMRRRLDLAASLVGRPQVLFLDEPTTGLDPRARLEVWGMVRELLATGVTVLLTTQYLDEADQLAHEIAVVDHGRVIATGTPEELKAKTGAQTLEVRPADPSDVDRTRAIVEEVAGAPAELDGQTIHVPVGDPAVLPAVVRRLDAERIVVGELALRSASLDEVFLTLTGRPTENEEVAA